MTKWKDETVSHAPALGPAVPAVFGSYTSAIAVGAVVFLAATASMEIAWAAKETGATVVGGSSTCPAGAYPTGIHTATSSMMLRLQAGGSVSTIGDLGGDAASSVSSDHLSGIVASGATLSITALDKDGLRIGTLSNGNSLIVSRATVPIVAAQADRTIARSNFFVPGVGLGTGSESTIADLTIEAAV